MITVIPRPFKRDSMLGHFYYSEHFHVTIMYEFQFFKDGNQFKWTGVEFLTHLHCTLVLFCFDWILWIFLVFLNRLHSLVKMFNMFSWEYYFNFTNYFLFSLYFILNNKSQWINYIIIPEIGIICGGKTTRCFVALVGLSHFKTVH